jgi:serine/threonine-protein kinase RsbT
LIGSRKAKNQEETAMVLDKALREACVSIKQDADVLLAYQKGRALAAEMGFSNEDQMIVVIAIMEVARNIVRYAGDGEIVLSIVRQNGKRGMLVVARDNGPGIPNVKRALQDGYSTGGGLGLGLSGARRLMDEFVITSEAGKGTTIEMKKWR